MSWPSALHTSIYLYDGENSAAPLLVQARTTPAGNNNYVCTAGACTLRFQSEPPYWSGVGFNVSYALELPPTITSIQAADPYRVGGATTLVISGANFKAGLS